MSYDLFVFDPSAAPHSRAAFKAWYEKQVDWSDPANSDHGTRSPALRSWYDAMILTYPDMNGPDTTDADCDNDRITGYSGGPFSIYIDFRWSEAEGAYDHVRRMAKSHGVGFYDVSGDEGDGEIMFPDDEPRQSSGGAWRQIAQQFRDLGAGK